jgi:hypothetical protein
MIRSKKFRSASDILSQQNNAEAQNLDKSKSLQPRALTQRNGTPPEKVNNIMLQSQRLSNISPFFFPQDTTKNDSVPSEPNSDSSSQNTVLSISQPMPPPAPAIDYSQRRYLSQRSNTLRKSQSVKSFRRIPTDYFESVLLNCDVDLDHGEFYVLSKL